MDEELRDSLMEWYLRFGERVIDYGEYMKGRYPTDDAYCSTFIKHINHGEFNDRRCKITPEGLAYLKEKQYNGNPINENRSGKDD